MAARELQRLQGKYWTQACRNVTSFIQRIKDTSILSLSSNDFCSSCLTVTNFIKTVVTDFGLFPEIGCILGNGELLR